MDITRHEIFLGALLHDIGKFWQRADVGFSDKKSSLKPLSKALAEDICPVNDQGRFGYQHVIWTSQFFEEYSEIFERIPGFKKNLYENGNNEDSVINFAANHHKPMTELQALISLADWWSAGIDRREAKTFEKEQDDIVTENIKWGKERYKNIPLYSIFNNVNADGKKLNNSVAFGLNPLSIEENKFFPKSIKTKEDGINREQYKNLWEGFIGEFKKLPIDSMNGFSESLYFLLKKYTWCIPSNTMDMANVSLFDHLKTTAAFADCLYQYKLIKPNDFKWDSINRKLTLLDGKLPVLLVGGDISGIQKFIYNIASRKAAVSLKGRSFYLQLLIDSMIQRIISDKDIHGNLANIIYSSGGKFYMLLPNTDNVVKTLDKLKDEFENEIWDKHMGQLMINLSYIPFAYDNKEKTICIEDKKEKTIGDLWSKLADNLTLQKNRKFKNVLSNRFDDLFNPIATNGLTRVCAVTGIESDRLVKIDDKEKNEDATFVLPIVKEQTELGKILKDVDYIFTHKAKGNHYIVSKSKFNISILGISNYLMDKIEIIDDDAEFRKITSADVCRVKMINDVNFLAAKTKGNGVSYGYQFYGGNRQAINNRGENKTFEELAGESYLGVLRMDVDNLGKLFMQGISENDKSFSSYATLSFLLDYFFSGYLNTIRDRFKDHVNILYSGGDDVFAIGKWDSLIEFAEVVRVNFEKFVGRKDITISAGIVIVGSKFPIAKAAELAGHAEEMAKRNNGDEKNAINIFGENVSWNEEFTYVKQMKNEFIEKVKKDKMPKSILHRTMVFAKMKKKNDLGYLWHTAYFFKRFSESKSDSIKEFCLRLHKELFERPGLRNFELLAVAARWAELELKETI